MTSYYFQSVTNENKGFNKKFDAKYKFLKIILFSRNNDSEAF